MGGIGIWQLLIVLLIVVLLFGGKKIRTLGSDLGSAMRGFKKEMNEEDKPAVEKKDADFNDSNTTQKDESKQ